MFDNVFPISHCSSSFIFHSCAKKLNDSENLRSSTRLRTDKRVLFTWHFPIYRKLIDAARRRICSFTAHYRRVSGTIIRPLVLFSHYEVLVVVNLPFRSRLEDEQTPCRVAVALRNSMQHDWREHQTLRVASIFFKLFFIFIFSSEHVLWLWTDLRRPHVDRRDWNRRVSRSNAMSE